MKKEQKYITKMILLTVWLTLSMIGLIMSIFFLYLWSFKMSYVFILVASVVSLLVSIKFLLKLSQKNNNEIISEIKEEKVKILANWEIEVEEWKTYLKEQGINNSKSLKVSGMGIFIFGSIVGFFILSSDKTAVEKTVLHAFYLGGGISLVITGITMLYNQLTLKKLSVSNTGKIMFTENVALVNDLVISFGGAGSSITGAKLDIDRETPVINIEISTVTGRGVSMLEHSIPVNTKDLDEVEKILSLSN